MAMPEIRPGTPQPDAGAPVTIVLIDDHAIVRQGLRSLLEREIDLRVVGEASSPGEALVVVERTRPMIVLLDMKLSPASDSDGLSLCAELTKRYPGPVTALDQLTVAVGPGITGLVGSNGAGKSTLIKVLLGLLPAGGVVEVLGQPPRRGNRR